ncbi:conserved hypothetical protein [Alkaliphilus metalliredigens QYMF]|uniref:DUF2184 domain-containing protein n=1 Tax=Alkaliphilus metalliredigens (strain QYMF) TaxID=293826 RepID=A6TKD0_ALKMQ|nr:DUF2184 domain-containing protein [Alkaliphilus metalliredigens]ABR46648.1 conserved hypothetical protein [Alkaliphilus metalliredigens QYMF]ABR48120.1 conserved hypothetical protein [Alkaliphilus metalliredigens QYMF]ABR50435.1 conserved hypothetical protein [Alkaliphilus metalliredigens QYMF]
MRGMHVRQDGMLLNQDLESIDKVAYEAKEEELTARTVVGLKTDDHEGAETISYDKMTRRGAAKIFAYGASDDIPLVDADVERHTQKVYGVVVGFTIGIQEKRAAQMANRTIDITKAIAARRAVAEKENRFFYVGSEAHQAEGLLNFTGIQTMPVALNAGETSTKWKDKTSEEIIEDIRLARKKVNALPGLTVDTLLLPPNQYEDLDKPVNAENYNMTIRKWLQEQKWFTNIIRVADLEGAGDSSTDCLAVFDSSKDVVEMALPLDITRHPEVMLANMSSQINLEERTGGAIVRFPMGICRADGI